jgi:hypothetical protein
MFQVRRPWSNQVACEDVVLCFFSIVASSAGHFEMAFRVVIGAVQVVFDVAELRAELVGHV